jgi:hypothetical protein
MRLAGWFCCDLGGLCLGLSCQKSTKYDHTHRYVYIYMCSIQYIHAKYGDNKVFKLQTIWAYDYILVNMAWHHAIKPNENFRHCTFHLPCGTYSAPHHHHLPWGLPGLGRNISTQVFFFTIIVILYIYIYLFIYLYICMHTCIHTLHCIALHYIT